jgi:hypothetical protein
MVYGIDAFRYRYSDLGGDYSLATPVVREFPVVYLSNNELFAA